MSREKDHVDDDFEVGAYDSKCGLQFQDSYSGDDFECYTDDHRAPSSDDKTSALLAHIGVIAVGVLAPIGIWVWKRQRRFVSFHARQALNHQITLVLWNCFFLLCGALTGLVVYRLFESQPAAMITGFSLFGLLAMCLAIFSLICTVRGSVAASNGNVFRYPLTISFF